MAKPVALIRGLGIIFLGILVLFVVVFFYTFFTGGESNLLTLIGGDGVGVLQIDGSIDDSREAIHNLKNFAETKNIKAVVVRIDSPGGGVVPTQEIAVEVEKLKKKKPVIASLGGMATSGGYYIASAANQIVANPGTVTGSIGVIMELANVEGLMDKLGLKEYNIKSVPYKDIGSPFKPLSPEGKAILQSLVENVHGQFVRAVARGRGKRLPYEKVREIADGRIFSGEQAKEAGLVDVLGTLEDAIGLAAKEGSIKGKPQIVYARAIERRWWERLLFSFFSERIEYKKRWGLRYQWSPLWTHRQSATMPP